jgi:hypothetical protein
MVPTPLEAMLFTDSFQLPEVGLLFYFSKLNYLKLVVVNIYQSSLVLFTSTIIRCGKNSVNLRR